MNPLKKENSWQKSFFQTIYEALKISEKWYDDVKSNIKQQQIKDLVAASYKFL